MIYFDANATVALDPRAESIWLEESRRFWHNPSSPYSAGATAYRRLESCRELLASMLECEPPQIVFCGGATEASNALMAWLGHHLEKDAQIIVSAVEHPCVLTSARFHFGERCRVLPVDTSGIVRLDILERWLREGKTGLVAVMAANNETGVVQPLSMIQTLCRKAHCWFYSDAVQWFGKLSYSDLPQVDIISGCAHKYGGPKGVGFLKIPTVWNGFHGQLGGHQENDHRAGTENLPSISAMVELLAMREEEIGAWVDRWQRGREYLENTLLEKLPGVEVVGRQSPRLPNTSYLLMPRYANTRWVTRLDRKGYIVSTGSACSSGRGILSAVLHAMGIAEDRARRGIRISADWGSDIESWKALADAILAVWEELETEARGPSQVIQI